MQKLVAGHFSLTLSSLLLERWISSLYSKACLADAFGKIALQLAETQ
jgi:hypothetical protein